MIWTLSSDGARNRFDWMAEITSTPISSGDRGHMLHGVDSRSTRVAMDLSCASAFSRWRRSLSSGPIADTARWCDRRPVPGTPAAHSSRMPLQIRRGLPSGGGRQHLFPRRSSSGVIKQGVRRRALQPVVLVLERLQPPDLHQAPAGELFLPPIERRLRHPELATNLLHRRPVLRLPQGAGDLFVRIPFCASWHPPVWIRIPENSHSRWTRF